MLSKKMKLLFLLMTLIVSNSHANCYPMSVSEDNPANPYVDNPLKVFLDLGYWADADYIRQQIPVVDYVRDKEDADVHIIMTRHHAGQAGTNYALSFIGSAKCSEMKNNLKH